MSHREMSTCDSWQLTLAPRDEPYALAPKRLGVIARREMGNERRTRFGQLSRPKPKKV